MAHFHGIGPLAPAVARSLAAFFDQFEPAEGWRPRFSEEDQRAMDAPPLVALDGGLQAEGPEIGSREWWDIVCPPNPRCAREHAREFAARMRAEREAPPVKEQ